MNEEMNFEDVIQAGLDVWLSVEDHDMRQGAALVVGRLLLPDIDGSAQQTIASLILEGAVAAWS